MTDRETAFVNAYLSNGFNETAAARAAKYANPNAEGSRIRSRPDVAAEIESRMAEYGMGANEAVARIAAIARGDMTDFMDDSGTGLDLAKAKAAFKLGLIKSYKFSRKSGLSVEMYDKAAALRDIGRVHKIFVDRHEHSFADDSDEELIERAKGLFAGVVPPGADPTGEG